MENSILNNKTLKEELDFPYSFGLLSVEQKTKYIFECEIRNLLVDTKNIYILKITKFNNSDKLYFKTYLKDKAIDIISNGFNLKQVIANLFFEIAPNQRFNLGLKEFKCIELAKK